MKAAGNHDHICHMIVPKFLENSHAGNVACPYRFADDDSPTPLFVQIDQNNVFCHICQVIVPTFLVNNPAGNVDNPYQMADCDDPWPMIEKTDKESAHDCENIVTLILPKSHVNTFWTDAATLTETTHP